MFPSPSRDSWRPAAAPPAPVAQDDTVWLITLCDLLLLLLCFLIFSYIRGKHETKTLAPTHAVDSNHQRQAAAKEIPDKSPAEPMNWDATRAELEVYVEQLGLAGAVRVESSGGELLITLQDSVPFESGRADLRPLALPILEKVAAVALGQPALQLEVGGHTDDRPIASEIFPSNWELSTARASGVARYLIEKGVHPARLSVQGFANYKPRASNSNPQSRGDNRRVEIRLFQAVEKAPAQK